MTTPVNRRLFDVSLRPMSGSRFQPTGFPDIGAATFKRPYRDDGGELRHRECLLVESPQSMGNHLEAVGWDEGSQSPVAALAGLPYVRVVAKEDDRYVTSSRTEAHRLSSAFIRDSFISHDDGKTVGMLDEVKERFGLRDDTPLEARHIAAQVMAMDPLCLIHGVFFSAKAWPGQPKIARAVTGFVEATDVEPVVSGGVKRDDVRHSKSESGGAAEGYGHVPFHRMEYAAAEIAASFSLDLAQLRSYGLGDDATALLEAIALWEVRSLLDGGMRLRTACDLEPTSHEIRDRAGQPLPTNEELEAAISGGVETCKDSLRPGGPIEVVWSPKGAKS